MSELQAQKAYMRQKVQQRQQEAKLQQQAAAVCPWLAELDSLCGCAGIVLTPVYAANFCGGFADFKAAHLLQSDLIGVVGLAGPAAQR